MWTAVRAAVVGVIAVVFWPMQTVLPYPIEARIIGKSLATFSPGVKCLTSRNCQWIFRHPSLLDHEVITNAPNLSLDGNTLFRYGDYYYIDSMTNEIISAALALYNKSKAIFSYKFSAVAICMHYSY